MQWWNIYKQMSLFPGETSIMKMYKKMKIGCVGRIGQKGNIGKNIINEFNEN